MRRIAAAVLAAGMVATLAPALPVSAAPTPAFDPASAITWTSCDDTMTAAGFECGALDVPVDWDDPANPDRASIAFAIKRSTASDRIGAFTFNPGGPGGSGLDSAIAVEGLVAEPLAGRFDFVAWDPRGVGQSTPQLTGCAVPAEDEFPQPPVVGPVDWSAYVNAEIDLIEPLRAQCFDVNPRVAPYLGTYYVIRDLDALRAALGEEQWTYWGMSYGTRVGFRYARTFPTRLRAFLLDGSVAPNETMLTRSGQTAYKYANVNATFTAAMGEGMAAKYSRVVRTLSERTVTVDDTTYDRWQVFPHIYPAIGAQRLYPRIRALIDELNAAIVGQPASARRIDRALTALPASPLPAADSEDPSQAYLIDMVNCADVHTWPSRQQVVDIVRTATIASDYTGSMDALGRSTHCFGLPPDFAPRFTPLARPLSLTTPPIVIQAYGDPATAWIGGRQMSNYFTGAPLVSYTGTAHVAYLRTPSTCINAATTRYLLTLRVPPSRTCAYVPTPE
ncbi:MAG: alpha/beta hydrolase [Actinobacteria bacterium]|nr:alpha/beta hydrolase [Actinomycetota bacterium]